MAGQFDRAAPNTLPAGTTVAIGNGLLDIGPHDVTLGGLTFTGTNPGVVYVADRQGISGTGTLRLTGPIRVVSNGLGWGNAINVPVDAGGGTLRVEAGGFQPAQGDLVPQADQQRVAVQGEWERWWRDHDPRQQHLHRDDDIQWRHQRGRRDERVGRAAGGERQRLASRCATGVTRWRRPSGSWAAH